MTPEHDHPEHQSHHTIDAAIGEVSFWGEAWTLRLAADLTATPYRATAHTEVVPLTGPQGTCTSVHGRPYILLPEFRATVALDEAQQSGDAIGRITGTTWEGMRMEPIGELQAWYYDTDRL